MEPFSLGAAALAGGAGLIGTMFSNQAASAQADRNRDFQKNMSDTAHQREVNDLRQAGLNPILSAGGAGAATPAGAMADVKDMGAPIKHGIDTAMAIRAQNKEFEAKDAGIQNMQEDTKNKGIQRELLQQQNLSTAQDIKQKEMSNKILLETLPSAIKKAKAEGDYKELQEIMTLIQKGANSIGDLMPLTNMLKKAAPIILGPRK